LDAKFNGEKALDLFVQEMLYSGSESFHVPLKKLKLPAFRDTRKKVSTTYKRGDVIRSDRDSFHHLTVVGQNKRY